MFLFLHCFSIVIFSHISSLFVPVLLVNGDGLVDLYIGDYLGKILYYKNVGTKIAPSFQKTTSPFGSLDFGVCAAPTLLDVNGDGLIGKNIVGFLIPICLFTHIYVHF